MRPQQVVDRVWIQFGDEIVGTLGVFDLKDVATVTEDALPVEDGGHGSLIELVPLDHEGGVDRLYPELPMQGGAFRQRRLRGEHAHKLCDLHAERVNHVVSLERRLVCHGRPSFQYRHNYTANGGKAVPTAPRECSKRRNG